MNLNIGDLKAYLSGGDIQNKRPEIKGLVNTVSMDSAGDVAKTLLKKTLSQHDAMYHRNGYRSGDSCNFRDALAKGDPVDIISLKKDEGEEKVGLVKYVEKDNGEKKITGVEEVIDTVATSDVHSGDEEPSKSIDDGKVEMKKIDRYLSMVER